MSTVVNGLGPGVESRLLQLVEVNRALVGVRSLHVLLEQFVSAARRIVGAELAVLAVVGPDGALERTVQCGMDARTIAAISDLPKGRCLIGAPVDDSSPHRIRSVSDDPHFCGVPVGHPTLTGVLGVPVRSGSSAYGTLYLANPVGRAEFSSDDEQVIVALAATAGVAVENARFHEMSDHRQRWLAASADISQRLLSAPGGTSLLEDISDFIRELSEAGTVYISVPVVGKPAMLEIEVASGPDAARLRGLRYPAGDSFAGEAMRTGRGAVVTDLQERLAGFGDARSELRVSDLMALPLKGEGEARGAIVICRGNGVPFSEAELELAEGFTSQATLALEMDDARTTRHRLAMLDNRARIARRLNDVVVQKLVETATSLGHTAAAVRDSKLKGSLIDSVAGLDDVVSSVRVSIFAVEELSAASVPVRGRVNAVVAQLAPLLGFAPTVELEGPLDAVVSPLLANEVEAVLRESLTNVAKHARANAVGVELATNGWLLCLTIADDGIGLGASGRRSGLSNLRHRAEQHGGHLGLERPLEGGLMLRWTVPLLRGPVDDRRPDRAASQD